MQRIAGQESGPSPAGCGGRVPAGGHGAADGSRAGRRGRLALALLGAGLVLVAAFGCCRGLLRGEGELHLSADTNEQCESPEYMVEWLRRLQEREQ